MWKYHRKVQNVINSNAKSNVVVYSKPKWNHSTQQRLLLHQYSYLSAVENIMEKLLVMHDWAQFYCHHHREHFFSNNYISVFHFPVELLHMQLVPEHFIHTSHWIILAKSAGNNALPLCQSWIQQGKRNKSKLPVSWQGLQLHLEPELRGQAEVVTENTERN